MQVQESQPQLHPDLAPGKRRTVSRSNVEVLPALRGLATTHPFISPWMAGPVLQC